jgi:hypothetical protein
MNKFILLPVFLYGCDFASLALREANTSSLEVKSKGEYLDRRERVRQQAARGACLLDSLTFNSEDGSSTFLQNVL